MGPPALSTAQDDVCDLVQFLAIEQDQSTGMCPSSANGTHTKHTKLPGFDIFCPLYLLPP